MLLYFEDVVNIYNEFMLSKLSSIIWVCLIQSVESLKSKIEISLKKFLLWTAVSASA